MQIRSRDNGKLNDDLLNWTEQEVNGYHLAYNECCHKLTSHAKYN